VLSFFFRSGSSRRHPSPSFFLFLSVLWPARHRRSGGFFPLPPFAVPLHSRPIVESCITSAPLSSFSSTEIDHGTDKCWRILFFFFLSLFPPFFQDGRRRFVSFCFFFSFFYLLFRGRGNDLSSGYRGQADEARSSPSFPPVGQKQRGCISRFFFFTLEVASFFFPDPRPRRERSRFSFFSQGKEHGHLPFFPFLFTAGRTRCFAQFGSVPFFSLFFPPSRTR